MTFQIDGSTVKEPISFAWEPPVVIGFDHVQKPIYAVYRAAIANFNALTTSEFASWVNADNGAYHSIQCPTPSGSTSGSYSNVVIQKISGQYGAGGIIYGAAFRVTRLVA